MAQYKKIILPLDGSGWAEAAIPHAARIAKNNDAELILLHVFHSHAAEYQEAMARANPDAEFVDPEYEEVKRRLISLRNDLRNEGVTVRGHILFGRDPAYNICQYVESEGADLVVMSTHGRTGLARFMFGSVAHKVMEGVEVPVLLVRPDKSEEEMLDKQGLPPGVDI